MIKVSIIIPVYNTEAYLPACLESVQAQTLKDIEVICIDDASPDNCGQILDDCAARDSRIRVLHLPENRLQGYGRNRGREMARGEYVYFLDSDDMITPNAMEELYTLAKRDDLEGIFFDARVIHESEELARAHSNDIAVRKGDYEDRVYTGPELLSRFVSQEEWTCYPQRQFWNRAYLERENLWFPEGMIHEDEVFAFQAILAAERTRYVRQTWFIRRYRENSVMTGPISPRNFYGYFMGYCYMNQFIHERRLACEAADRVLSSIFNNMVRVYGLLPDKEALENVFQTPESRHLYWFFQASQKAEIHFHYMRQELKTALEHCRHIYIYGAGRIARTVAKRLYYGGFDVEYFVVTSKEGNPDALFGIPVISLNELQCGPDSIAVVAVAPALQTEITPLLAERRIPYIIYNGDRAVTFD